MSSELQPPDASSVATAHLLLDELRREAEKLRRTSAEQARLIQRLEAEASARAAMLVHERNVARRRVAELEAHVARLAETVMSDDDASHDDDDHNHNHNNKDGNDTSSSSSSFSSSSSLSSSSSADSTATSAAPTAARAHQLQVVRLRDEQSRLRLMSGGEAAQNLSHLSTTTMGAMMGDRHRENLEAWHGQMLVQALENNSNGNSSSSSSSSAAFGIAVDDYLHLRLNRHYHYSSDLNSRNNNNNNNNNTRKSNSKLMAARAAEIEFDPRDHGLLPNYPHMSHLRQQVQDEEDGNDDELFRRQLMRSVEIHEFDVRFGIEREHQAGLSVLHDVMNIFFLPPLFSRSNSDSSTSDPPSEQQHLHDTALVQFLVSFNTHIRSIVAEQELGARLRLIERMSRHRGFLLAPPRSPSLPNSRNRTPRGAGGEGWMMEIEWPSAEVIRARAAGAVQLSETSSSQPSTSPSLMSRWSSNGQRQLEARMDIEAEALGTAMLEAMRDVQFFDDDNNNSMNDFYQ